MARSGNLYCERLETLRVPRVEEFVGRRLLLGPATLFDLMIVALLESGGPMALEAIASRLEEAGASSGAGDMLLSLKKSWRRREPIYEDEAGLLALNVTHPDLDLRLFVLGLRPPHVEPLPEPPPTPIPPEDVPLSLQEVDAAFRGRRLVSQSATRTAAAVLDAHGKPMTFAEIDRYLASIDVETFPLDSNQWEKVPSALVARSGSILELGRDPAQLGSMRKAIRALAKPEIQRRARKEHTRIAFARSEALRAERERKERDEAASLHRAILRLLPEAGEVAAAAILVLQTMSVRTFVLDEVERAREALEPFDVVIGLGVRDSLKRLGVPMARYRTLELGPPRRTLKLNDRGDRLRLTPELVISSTTGIRRPLSDPAKMASDLLAGRSKRVRRSLERDLASLQALYEYVRLHGYVRVRYGFLDERLPFDWQLPRDVDFLYSTLKAAERERRLVEIVLGPVRDEKNAPGSPTRGYVSDVRWEGFRFQAGPWIGWCDCADVQAVRSVPEP